MLYPLNSERIASSVPFYVPLLLMSIFARPDSPPPRQPSPVPMPPSLPSPPLRTRDIPRQPRMRTPPPGLEVSVSEKRLLSVCSFECLRNKENKPWESSDSESSTENHRRKRTRSTLTPSPPTTPRSLQLPAQKHIFEQASKPHHRRCLSVAMPRPYRSPPASPNYTSRPPPVPPLPSHVLSSPIVKPLSCPPQQLPITPIYLPDLDDLSPISEMPISLSRKQGFKIASPPSKQRSMGMTCFKFFTLRNAGLRAPRTTTV